MTTTTPELWPHQAAAVQSALDYLGEGGGGFGLFFEQRAGKTRTAIEIAKRRNARRILVLTPSKAGELPKVWKREIMAQWPDSPPVIVLEGTAREKAAKVEQLNGMSCIVICNYESVWMPPLGPRFVGARGRIPQQFGAIYGQQWDVLICDEIHHLKQHNGSQHRAIAAFARRIPVRLGLTGTPVPHSVLDVWGIYHVLDWTVFEDTYTRFRLHYSRKATRAESHDADTYMDHSDTGPELVRWKLLNIDEISEKMYAPRIPDGPPRAVRVRTRDVFPNMPPELDDDRHIALEPAARRAYNAMQRSMVAEIAKGVVTAANAGVKVLRLQQLTGGTLNPEDIETGEHEFEVVSTAKEHALQELLETLDGRPVVVYCRFHTDLDAAHRAAAAAGLSSSEISGRTHSLEAWQQGATQVLAAQIQAAGEGVDMTRASTVIYYSMGHSLLDYTQSRSRILGPLQTEPAMFYHLLCEGTVDELIYEALHARADVVSYVVERLGRATT